MSEGLSADGELPSELAAQLRACTLCPRQCGVDRYVRRGYCGAGAAGRVAKAFLHPWEELRLSDERGLIPSRPENAMPPSTGGVAACPSMFHTRTSGNTCTQPEGSLCVPTLCRTRSHRARTAVDRLKTKRAIICAALKALILLYEQAEVRQLRGKLTWQGDLEAQRLSRLEN